MIFNTKIDFESKMANKLKAKLNIRARFNLNTLSLKLNKYNNITKKNFCVLSKFRAPRNDFRVP